MAQATTTRNATSTKTSPTIHYQVALSSPESHLFGVTLQISNFSQPILDLKMPVWTPGSYLVREYAKNVQDLTATTPQQPLVSRKISKNHWQIETQSASEITVFYHVYANELSVRTNHLNSTHGYFNGAALFMFVVGYEDMPVDVSIIPPKPDWRVTTSLPAKKGEENRFTAADFDTLVDSPFEIGTQRVYDFEVLGKPHQLAIWGEGNANSERIIEDTKKIIEVEAKLFGGLPYDHYLFLLHLSASGFGGLEHKDSCSLNYPRFGFRATDKYNRFMQLVAHEFFHLWNVKRIRPKAIEKFDYTQEAYTTSLWFCEGTTSYYDAVIPYRAGIYDRKTFFENLSKDITRLQTTPGRQIQPLSESSFDAWIKLYRRDANSDNSQISYYLKGEMVSFLLDLRIRARHNNARSLDDVMQSMWHHFGKEEIGFTPSELREVIERVADTDLSDFFARYVDGTEELPFNEYLKPFGLEIAEKTEDDAAPSVGIKLASDNGKNIVKFVEMGSPAAKVGIDAGDELLAINGIRVTSDSWRDRLQDYAPGDTISITVFHQDELRSYSTTLGQPQPTRYEIVKVKHPSESQRENLSGWIR